MNETRKQIIELIELFMDKKKTKWCLFKTIVDKSDINYYWEIWEIKAITKDWDIQVWWLDKSNFKAVFTKKEFKKHTILWHYDITAVLRYIEKSELDIILWECYWWPLRVINWQEIVFWEIPNKPLTLYTEQEEKQLLELLLKLK